MKKLEINSASKTYISSLIISVVSLFIICGVVFLAIICNKLDIVMNTPSGITYTYFMMIMDRILFGVLVLFILPISIYQWIYKDLSNKKTKGDKVITILSVFVLAIFLLTILCGEMRFYEKYNSGDFDNSKLFPVKTFEMNTFDKIKS